MDSLPPPAAPATSPSNTATSPPSSAPTVLANLLWQYGLPTSSGGESQAVLAQRIMEHVEANFMSSMYESSCAVVGRPVDAAVLARLKAKNASDLADLDAKLLVAKEKFGESEVFEAQRDRADYVARSGDHVGALEAYDALPRKGLSTGQRIDIVMAKTRLAFAHGQWPLAKTLLVEAKELNEKGGDWDRRNRLKVYEAVLAMLERDFKRASTLLLDSIATFTATELFDYATFTFYVVLAGLLSLERAVLKKRVIDSPDVLAAISDVPHLAPVLNAYYECRYSALMASLVALYPAVVRDRYLSRHAPFILRELRIGAYTQFLESYKSVTLRGMADAFGVRDAFLDAELSRFIAAGRIHAQMDAVAGVIETTRPDSKNSQYAAVIKQGDLLLNKVQRLSRVVTM